MNDQEASAILSELLKLQPYYNVATTGNGQPWNSPVWAVRDESFNLYWSSWTQATHSRNIAANPKVFLTLFDSTRVRGTNNFRCLYLQCVAHEVTEPSESAKAANMLYPDEAVDLSDFHGAGLKRFYRATPIRAWLNCLSLVL
jgi:hypothetical protein